MKYLSALLVVLAVFTLGTTTLATTATAGEIYAPHNWDTGDGGIVSYGDPDGGGSGISGRGLGGSTATTYRDRTKTGSDFELFSRQWMMMRQYLLIAVVRQSMRLW